MHKPLCLLGSKEEGVLSLLFCNTLEWKVLRDVSQSGMTRTGLSPDTHLQVLLQLILFTKLGTAQMPNPVFRHSIDLVFSKHGLGIYVVPIQKAKENLQRVKKINCKQGVPAKNTQVALIVVTESKTSTR